jgi:hypothetical protein
MSDGGVDATPSGEGEQTIEVDDELVESVAWVERELREARKALWDGKSGKAFTAIEAAQDEHETIEELVLDE